MNIQNCTGYYGWIKEDIIESSMPMDVELRRIFYSGRVIEDVGARKTFSSKDCEIATLVVEKNFYTGSLRVRVGIKGHSNYVHVRLDERSKKCEGEILNPADVYVCTFIKNGCPDHITIVEKEAVAPSSVLDAMFFQAQRTSTDSCLWKEDVSKRRSFSPEECSHITFRVKYGEYYKNLLVYDEQKVVVTCDSAVICYTLDKRSRKRHGEFIDPAEAYFCTLGRKNSCSFVTIVEKDALDE